MKEGTSLQSLKIFIIIKIKQTSSLKEILAKLTEEEIDFLKNLYSF